MAVLFLAGDMFTGAQGFSLAHGCNCAGAMGKGIAVQFKRRYPSMYMAYKSECLTGQLVPGGVFPWQTESGDWVYNLGTQKHWRTKARLPDIVASTQAMVQHAEQHGVKAIRMPAVGAGLGGLPWDSVRESLVAGFQDAELDLLVYQDFEANRPGRLLALYGSPKSLSGRALAGSE